VTLIESLVQALPSPILVLNRAGIIASANEAAIRICEARGVINGLPFTHVLTDTRIIQQVQTSIDTRHASRGSYTRGSEDSVWNVTATPLSGNGTNDIAGDEDTFYVLVTIEDVAAQRRLEQVQRDFIANVSHELRTPLTSIRLLAETLEDILDTDTDKAQEFVEKIETEAQYLTAMVSELLDLSRIESGQQSITLEHVESEQLVREVMARLLPQAQRHRVALGTDIQQGKTRVQVDSRLIARVLVNLIHNAIKFTPSGGTITIGTYSQDERVQAFFVRDTGVGIRKEELPRIFERFYKTDRSRSKIDFIGPGGGGSGLGLAIARHLVELHQGHIFAASTIGQGSVFTFTLPKAPLHGNET
jgi:two-component system phosphate regulon sensor histidine kinase PhoR